MDRTTIVIALALTVWLLCCIAFLPNRSNKNMVVIHLANYLASALPQVQGIVDPPQPRLVPVGTQIARFKRGDGGFLLPASITAVNENTLSVSLQECTIGHWSQRGSAVFVYYALDGRFFALPFTHDGTAVKFTPCTASANDPRGCRSLVLLPPKRTETIEFALGLI